MDKPGYWAVIPATVRYDPDLPPNAKLLYGEITALSGAQGYCYAQNSYFTALFGLTDRSVTRLLSTLSQRGYLRIDVRRDEGTNEVQERRLYAVYGQGKVPPPPDNFVGTPPDKNDRTPPDKNVGENNTSIYNIPPIVPQKGDGKKGRKSKSVPAWKPERFEKFWAYYPRHEDRVAAVRAWDKLKPDDATLAAMGQALERQKATPGWPAPYACRYLSHRRWEDEAPATPPELPQPGLTAREEVPTW